MADGTGEAGAVSSAGFDWERTRRELVLFIPNYGRKRYLRSCLASLTRTRVPRDRWLVIVGNDGLDEPMDDLASEFNLGWFTLPRAEPGRVRNGAFIRNYAIKRCQSRLFFQKDPEVALVPDTPDYDIIGSMMAVQPGSIWRNGRPYDVVFNEAEIDRGVAIDERVLRFLPQVGNEAPNASWPGLFGFHWGFCVETQALKDLRGYDERFTHYGPEDSDMMRRLKRAGHRVTYDPRVYAIHVHHEVQADGCPEMQALGKQIEREPPLRNDPERWGEGGTGD